MNRSRRILQIMLSLAVCGVPPAMAQSDRPRLEVGADASFLRLSAFDTTNVGVGGRATFDLTRWAALEGTARFFPKDNVLLPSSSAAPDLRVEYRRRRAEVFGGIKLGMRRDKLGVFAKIRPGFTRLSATEDGVVCAGPLCPLALLVRPEYRTEFAFDLGGILEFYPTARTVPRFEIGDTVVRHRSFAPPCEFSNCTSHNLSSQLGIGFRF